MTDFEEYLDSNQDPRATLGVRPGARPRGRPALPPLQLTQSAGSAGSSRPPSPRSPVVYTNGDRRGEGGIGEIGDGGGGGGSGGLSIVTLEHTRLISGQSNATAADASARRRRRPTISRKNRPDPADPAYRGLYETQKMLNHLIERLEARRRGPDVLSRAAAAARHSSERAKPKNAVKQLGKVVVNATVRTTTKAGKAITGGADDDDDDGDYDEDMAAVEDGTWDTDATYDLLEQTRSLLILADRQGLDLFGDSGVAATEAATRAAKAKAKSRAGRFPSISVVKSNDSSDVFQSSDMTGNKLLKRLAAVVQSLVTTDCVYITQRFRLLKPPYALQTLVLDIAALVYHKGDLDIKVLMMGAVIESLYTMGAPVHERLCQWLEGRMGELLRTLAAERHPDDHNGSKVEFGDPFAGDDRSVESPSVPTFAFSAPEDASQPAKKGWMRYSPVGPNPYKQPDKIVGILSIHSPNNISRAAIQIASLVPRTLVAVTTMIDLTTCNLTTIHCVYRLLSLVLTAKPDAGLDVLEITAHGPPVTRRRGMDILATYFATTVGHNVIARRPALTTYAAHRAKWETGQDRSLLEEDTEGHYYVPWRPNPDLDKCVSCLQPCRGFAVKCTLCGDLKHFYCLKQYDEVTEYSVTELATASKPHRVGNISARYSLVPPRSDELVLGGGPSRGTTNATERQVGQHHLRLVNLFTLTLCDECKQPLWGTMAQAYVCQNQCQRFFHPVCVDNMSLYKDPICSAGRHVLMNLEAVEAEQILDPFTTNGLSIHESFKEYKHRLCYDPDELHDMSYDEISCLYANLWIQHEIYLNGISVGTLRLVDVPLEDDITGVALLLSQYEVLLSQHHLSPSPALIDFANVSAEDIPAKGCLLWQPRYLQYCAALLRAPSGSPPTDAPSPGGFLAVASSSFNEAEEQSVAYEQVPISIVQQALASDLHLRDDLAASTLIEQLRQFGLITIPNLRVVDKEVLGHNANVNVVTPLPLLMDSSPDVELLVLAIEGLLEDIDLTANEQGLSLLVKQAWPSIMCSPYAMIRLGGAVMSWIMDEDDVLHHIVKNYARNRKRPPGVRAMGMSTSETTSAVASYKDDRGRLLNRYARPWLEALCFLDPIAYGDVAYERSKIIEHRYESIDLPKGPEAAAVIAQIALTRLTALADADVMFMSLTNIITNWIDDLGAVLDSGTVFKHLPRLARHAATSGDLWRDMESVSDDGPDSFAHVCLWLRALTFSGVKVPWEVITRLADKHAVGRKADDALFNLVVAVDANTEPMEQEPFAQLCNTIFTPLATSMASSEVAPTPQEVEMLTITMMSLLKAYGASPEAVAETTLASQGQSKILARRKVIAWPVAIAPLHPDIVFAAARILKHKANPGNIVLDILWLLFTKAPGVEDVQGLLHEVCPELSSIVWKLYDRHDIDRHSRSRLFLKLLTINNKPIEEVVAKESKGTLVRETRERLFQFVLQLADESLGTDVKNWRRAAVGLITIFFESALQPLDPSPETLPIWKGLLPTQLRAISTCFEEFLETSLDEHRVQLILKLLRIRSHLPHWPVVGWPIIEQILSEQTTTIRQFEHHNVLNSVMAVSDARNLMAVILSLAMQMLAAKVECQWAVLQRIQQHVAATCALPWPEPSDTVTGILLPALKTLLDSTARTTVADETGHSRITKETKETTLVGSLFVPIVIGLAADLRKCDFAVQQCILDILLVIFFKHNVQPYELSALTTLQSLAAFAADAGSNENRLVALQVLRTAQTRMPKDRFSRVLPSLFVRVADIMFKETKTDGDSAIIDSCREILHASILEFGKAGLFLQVLRADGQQSAGNIEPEAIGRAMQVAARQSGSKNKNVWLDQVILDLPDVIRWPRDQMAHVLQSMARLSATLKDGLSEDSAFEFGAFLSRLGKHSSEWDNPENINLNPVFQTLSALLDIAPASAALTLLHQISNFLHLVLHRYSISVEQIRKLVPVSIRVARRQQTENTVATVLFEMCISVLKGQPVTPGTLNMLLTWLGDEDDPNLKSEKLSLLAQASPGCATILCRQHPTLRALRDPSLRDPELTMSILKAAATVIIRGELDSPGNTGRVLRGLPNESASTQLDVFSHLLFASLDVCLGDSRSRIMSLYPVLGRAASLALFACADLLALPDPRGDGAHLASAAFAVMRLAILAVNDPPPKDGAFEASNVEAHDVLLSFWHRLWPEWDRLMGLSLAPSCINLPQRAVTLSVLMDIILFISANQPALLVEPAPTLSRGLDSLTEWHQNAGTQVPAKIHKAAAALDATALRSQPAANARRLAVAAVWPDMVATERLQSLRTLHR